MQYQHYPEPESQPAAGDVPVGVILRQARQHYGQSLADIEKALRIKRSQLEAIEAGEYDRLPGRVYAIGFIRSYSDYLGLDGEQMIAQFKIQVGEKSTAPELHFPVASSESKVPKPWVVAVSLFTAAFIILIWWSYAQRPPQDLAIVPPVPGESLSMADANLPHTPAPEAAAQDPLAATAPPAEPGIILSITSNSWVEIKDSTGNALVAKVLQAGDKYRIPDNRPDLNMSLGNAGGVMLEIDGKSIAPLGANGEVLRNMPLERNWLRKRYEPMPESQQQEEAPATPPAPTAPTAIEPQAGTPAAPALTPAVSAIAPAVSVAPPSVQAVPIEEDVPAASEIESEDFSAPNR